MISNCIILFFVGMAVGVSASNAGQNRQKFSLLPESITSIEGVLAEDSRIISDGKAMANITLNRCASISGNSFVNATAQGNITVFFPEYGTEKLREFGRGATIYSEGRLRSSGGAEDFFTFNADTVFVTKPASKIERVRTDIRLKLIDKAEGKEWGGLSLALLLGIRDNLDSNLAMMYRRAGCSYILALSGMHLAVLAAIIAFVLRRPLGLKLAAVTGAVLIILYCFLVGPLPSLTRAALMYIIGVVAILGFLPRNPLAILSLSFLIQIIFTPSQGHTISFILSYLALFGIFAVGQSLYELFAGLVPDFLMQPLSASLGAFIITAGITGSVFGYVAPIGIVASLALVPLTTLYMILSILWLVLDNLLNIPLSFLYKLMEWIVSVAAKVPAITAGNPAFFIALSIILPIIIVVFENRYRVKRLKMEPFR